MDKTGKILAVLVVAYFASLVLSSVYLWTRWDEIPAQIVTAGRDVDLNAPIKPDFASVFWPIGIAALLGACLFVHGWMSELDDNKKAALVLIAYAVAIPLLTASVWMPFRETTKSPALFFAIETVILLALIVTGVVFYFRDTEH